ncbi:MAG: radical SAM protein [Candidatus Zixiibacteriota bacterium]|nr:MAG: radical SAM protein [candidate division Zixibacteria bacterium]
MLNESLTKCLGCGESSPLISTSLPVCLNCIRTKLGEIEIHLRGSHRKSRRRFDLPPEPPTDEAGVKCNVCVNRCRISEGERGFCGLRQNRDGAIDHLAGTKSKGMVSWYYDPLPTNCVADWVCPGGGGVGYPDYSYARGAEYGFENLAVFYEACTFDCLFCQNWHFRESSPYGGLRSAKDLAKAVRDTTACICYFGGDPTPQLDHAIEASRLALEAAKDRILRICWETNGGMHRSLLKQMAELSMTSGGCIKFDLKTFDEKLNLALCGVTNKRTLDNFRYLVELSKTRPVPPFLTASTLMIPGYIDGDEVFKIAEFIASLDRSIPYSLLAFHPTFEMHDLPRTSRAHAEQCLRAAKQAGLLRVKIGNLHLLSEDY